MKVNIHYSLIIGLIICLYLGIYKEFLTMILIIFLHELGHIICAKIFKAKTRQVTLTILGGVSEIEDVNNNFIIALIYVSGIIVNIIIMFFSFFIDNDFFKLIFDYNLILLVFNLLPIFPLDGYFIAFNILKSVISFKKTFFILEIISIFFLCALFVFSIKSKSIGFIIVFCFLLIKNYEQLKRRDILYIKDEVRKYQKIMEK